VCPRPRALRVGPRGSEAHRPHHGARRDHIHGRQGDFASDDPGNDAKKLGGEVKLGAGPVLHRGAAGNQALLALAREVAAAEGIPVQVKALPGRTSTDAEELMASGQAATLSFSIPVRNMHSAFEVMQPDDAEAGALLAAGSVRAARLSGARREACRATAPTP
jgi:hypothetical protein